MDTRRIEAQGVCLEGVHVGQVVEEVSVCRLLDLQCGDEFAGRDQWMPLWVSGDADLHPGDSRRQFTEKLLARGIRTERWGMVAADHENLGEVGRPYSIADSSDVSGIRDHACSDVWHDREAARGPSLCELERVIDTVTRRTRHGDRIPGGDVVELRLDRCERHHLDTGVREEPTRDDVRNCPAGFCLHIDTAPRAHYSEQWSA